MTARTVIVDTGARYRRPLGRAVGALRGDERLLRRDADGGERLPRRPGRRGRRRELGGAGPALAQNVPQVRLLLRHHDLDRDRSRYLAGTASSASPTIEVVCDCEVRDLAYDETLEAIVVADASGDTRTIDAKALFVFIGAEPHTGRHRNTQ